MAGIMITAGDHFKELHEKEKDTKLKEKYQRKMHNMESYQENFVYLAGQQRSKDKDVLRFLGDPLNQFQAKRVIYELFSNSHLYPTILNYLLGLDSQFQFMIEDDAVILCPERKLAGLCRKQKLVSLLYIIFNSKRISCNCFFFLFRKPSIKWNWQCFYFKFSSLKHIFRLLSGFDTIDQIL